LSFSLYDPDLFSNLRSGATLNGRHYDGLTVFRTLVAENYNQVAGRFGASLKFSYDRTDEAYEYWMRDIGRVYDAEDAEPDHFKRAGFLAYWLRRRQVVHHVMTEPEGAIADKFRNRFLINHNEYCAFMFGFRICHYFSLAEKLEDSADIAAYIGSQNLEPEFVFDVSTLMKNKNVSPHSLYLIYRACFVDIQRPLKSRPAIVEPFPHA
jgi:hypothetical protein